MTTDEQAIAGLGEPEEFQIIRDRDRDLQFQGWLLGQGEDGTGSNGRNWTRGSDVAVYLTTGNRLVTRIRRWSDWVGENTVFEAAAHRTDEEALAWLMEQGGGELSPACKEAWEEACATYQPLKGRDVELVP